MVPPEIIRLKLTAPCVDRELLNQPRLVICIEGECQGYSLSGEGGCAGGVVRGRATRTVGLPFAELKRMGEAQRVGVRLGTSEVELSRKETQMLKRFAQYIEY